MSKRNLSIVIPSRNAENLIPCLEAIRKHEPNVRVIVVDDGIDNSFLPRPDLMPTYFLRGQKPFVFARNVNLGIVAAGSDDVLILNDDALLETPRGFSLLVQAHIDHPEFGIIASTCNNVGNRNQCPQGVGLREEPRMVCFVAVMIPRRTINQVGMLDEEFVGYGLDDDSYSLRVLNAGLKIGIHDGCYVDHGSLKSSYRGEASMPADFRPNLRIFIQKYGVDNWGRTKQTSDFPECFPA